MQIDVDAPETLFVSRQPILDATGKVFGYELLHREAVSAAPGAGGETAEAAGARGLTDVVLGSGSIPSQRGSRRSSTSRATCWSARRRRCCRRPRR